MVFLLSTCLVRGPNRGAEQCESAAELCGGSRSRMGEGWAAEGGALGLLGGRLWPQQILSSSLRWTAAVHVAAPRYCTSSNLSAEPPRVN